MNSPPTYPARIRRLLQTHTVMTVDQLRQALHGRSRSSVFRDLKQLEVITSYSHAGRYHAVVSRISSWNPRGNWPVCSVDGLPGMTEQSGSRPEPSPSPLS